MRRDRPAAVLIAGPTASGKSALALRLAREIGGAVVNADSMQVYAGLHILSAQPTTAEMGGVPHHLYGHRDPAEPYSVGDWLREVAPLLRRLEADGLVPIVTGGTGLYFRALLGGLDEMPAVPASVRSFWRDRMEREGPSRLHAVLAERDPLAATRLRPSDPQRIVRALELHEVRGPKAERNGTAGAIPLVETARSRMMVLVPDRAVLRERIARRFDLMLAAGAAEEAVRFAARNGAVEGLAGKAIGLAELLAASRGETSLAEARERAVTRTRQYAKRQETFFRNQFAHEWVRIAEPGDFRLEH